MRFTPTLEFPGVVGVVTLPPLPGLKVRAGLGAEIDLREKVLLLACGGLKDLRWGEYELLLATALLLPPPLEGKLLRTETWPEEPPPPLFLCAVTVMTPPVNRVMSAICINVFIIR